MKGAANFHKGIQISFDFKTDCSPTLPIFSLFGSQLNQCFIMSAMFPFFAQQLLFGADNYLSFLLFGSSLYDIVGSFEFQLL